MWFAKLLAAVVAFFKPADKPRAAAPKTRTPGDVAVERALSAWGEDIVDAPPGDMTERGKAGRTRIEGFIRDSGLGWKWVKYTGDGSFAWCGAFAAHAWAPHVPQEVRFKDFASTLRLRYAVSKGTVERIVDFMDIRPGDILVVGDRLAYGDHICLAERRYGVGQVGTIEGNATGEGPKGRMHGVIRRTRGADTIRFIYRPKTKE